jgi:hypothetical protein
MTTNNVSDAVRALWQQQPGTSFSMPAGEIQRKFSRLQKKLRLRMFSAYAICLVEAVWFVGWLIFTNPPAAVRISFLLIIFGLNFLAVQIWLDSRERRRILDEANTSQQSTCAEFYRAELVRQRNFHRGPWFWSRLAALLPGLLTISIWEVVAFPGRKPQVFGERMLAAIVVITIIGFWRNHQASRKYQRQIEAVDAITLSSHAPDPVK